MDRICDNHTLTDVETCGLVSLPLTSGQSGDARPGPISVKEKCAKGDIHVLGLAGRRACEIHPGFPEVQHQSILNLEQLIPSNFNTLFSISIRKVPYHFSRYVN
jgi:hypothetical protein